MQSLQYLDLNLLVSIFLVFSLAGLVKGVIGVGLPTVSLTLLTFILDIKQSIAIVLLPVILTNFYQMMDGKFFKSIINDNKYSISIAALSIIPGFFILLYFESQIILFFLGMILIINSLISIFYRTYKIANPKNLFNQFWIGSLTGIATGITSIYTMPLVLLIQSLNYTKEKTIQFMGILFFFFSVIQFVLFSIFKMITLNILYFSLFSIIPIFFGLFIGSYLRKNITEKFFKILFNFMLLIMGIIIIFKIIF